MGAKNMDWKKVRDLRRVYGVRVKKRTTTSTATTPTTTTGPYSHSNPKCFNFWFCLGFSVLSNTEAYYIWFCFFSIWSCAHVVKKPRQQAKKAGVADPSWFLAVISWKKVSIMCYFPITTFFILIVLCFIYAGVLYGKRVAPNSAEVASNCAIKAAKTYLPLLNLFGCVPKSKK